MLSVPVLAIRSFIFTITLNAEYKEFFTKNELQRQSYPFCNVVGSIYQTLQRLKNCPSYKPGGDSK